MAYSLYIEYSYPACSQQPNNFVVSFSIANPRPRGLCTTNMATEGIQFPLSRDFASPSNAPTHARPSSSSSDTTTLNGEKPVPLHRAPTAEDMVNLPIRTLSNNALFFAFTASSPALTTSPHLIHISTLSCTLNPVHFGINTLATLVFPAPRISLKNGSHPIGLFFCFANSSSSFQCRAATRARRRMYV